MAWLLGLVTLLEMRCATASEKQCERESAFRQQCFSEAVAQSHVLGRSSNAIPRPHAVVFGQQYGQRRAARKSASTSAQCRVDSSPRFTRAGHLTRVPIRQYTHSRLMRVGPGQDLIDGQRWKI